MKPSDRIKEIVSDMVPKNHPVDNLSWYEIKAIVQYLDEEWEKRQLTLGSGGGNTANAIHIPIAPSNTQFGQCKKCGQFGSHGCNSTSTGQ
jgi:hypothetical protein